ncbi:MAG TPA: hypothetical protein VFT82_04525 [Candidatus Paceibacterota bacterium]|nr:hypothetical protein [Candidatus Paceibacterota bacterium]
MNSYLMVIIAGACAGSWPLIMQKSGLSGAPAAIVYSVCSLAVALILFAAAKGSAGTAPINWWVALAAGLLAAAALVLLSFVIGKTSPGQLSLLYIVMILVQVAVPAIFFAFTNGKITLQQVLGLMAALLAAFLLK